MSPRRTRRARQERGLALLIMSISLVAMLIFASFAVDVGALYNHRRVDQNAADNAALAAAQDLGRQPSVLGATAMDYAEDTVGVDFTTAQWNTCATDSGRLASAVPGANCISYNSQQVRVRIPDQQYGTVFGRVVGVDSFRHSAFAIAGLTSAGYGGVLPFGITGPPAQGGFGCLQSNSNGQASAQCGSTAGNFGFLDFGQFGGTSARPTADCGSGSSTDRRIREGIALGIDHQLSIYGAAPHGSLQQVDLELCAASPQGVSPNAIDKRTGNQSTEATVGFFSGTAANFPDGQPARLARSDSNLLNGSAPARVTVSGVADLDNVPLWRFIPPGYGPGETTPADIPNSCRRNQFVDGSNAYTTANLPGAVATFVNNLATQRDRVLALTERCIEHFMGRSWTGSPVGVLSPAEAPTGCIGTCDSPIFALNSTTSDSPDLYDIQYTSRFGYVPEIDAFGSGSSGVVRIVDFHAIFIQRLRIERSGGDILWDPGVEAVPSTGSFQRVGETSVFVFPDGSLPNGLSESGAPWEIGVNRFVRLVR